MCHTDTCVLHNIRDDRSYSSRCNSRHHWCKKNVPLIRGVHFFESWAILVLFLKIRYFCTYIWGSQGKWKTWGSLWTKKRKKERIINCSNLKCFKTKYQLLKSIIQTLFQHKIIDMALLFAQHSYLLLFVFHGDKRVSFFVWYVFQVY